MEHTMSEHRAGYVGLIGRPNVGKSTLLNRVLGAKVAATADKPQTTRNRIAGIYNAPGVQAVVVDTPGIHKPRSRLNKSMVRAAMEVIQEVDLLVWLLDATELVDNARAERTILTGGDAWIAEQVEQSGKPALLALNKIDQLEHRWLLPVLEACSARLPEAGMVPISALKGDGVPALLEQIAKALPEHPPLFPPDQLLEQNERFVVAEIIREKVVRLTSKELPYVTAVDIEQFDEELRDEERPFVTIHARIIVERPSQKGIVIGKQGAMIKRIGSQARQDIQRLLGAGVHLELFVAVEADWTRNPRLLRQLGYE
jgi:GTP-binding protein Era